MQTAMSCPFPPEILDLIVDHLHNEPDTLKSCCVVSKSWVPRTRRHLFASVEFNALGFTVESWMETFPDPSNSPAHYTQNLEIFDIWPATAAGHWMRAFHGVVRLHMVTFAWDEDQVSLVPFRGLWPALKSLHLDYASIPLSEVFGLVCSFPLLEDLALFRVDHKNISDRWNTPSTSPKLTGSLNLRAIWGIWSTARRLLDLPNGLHFTKIVLGCVHEADFKSTTDLVLECSDTLEYLDVTYDFAGAYPSPLYVIGTLPLRLGPLASSFDLSAASKLKGLVFQCARPSVQWITYALETTKTKNLQQITIRPYGASLENPEEVHREWLDLDRLLVRFSTSRSIRPRAAYEPDGLGLDLSDYASSLFPELTRRGLVDLVEWSL